MAKQKTIGNNPLAAYLSAEQIPVETVQELTPEQLTHEVSVVKKQRVTIHVAHDIIERVKNAVFWEPGLTLAGFAEYALEQAINKLESERGTSFPQRRHPLRGGRPMK